MIKEFYNAGLNLIPLKKNSKIPIQENWTYTPALSYEEITKYKDVNYGLPVKKNGLVVIDVDTHDKEDPNKGFKSLNALQEFSGQSLPNTFTVQTPSGGQHFYFLLPDEYKERAFDKSLKRYPQIDLIVQNKMLVVPPSKIDGEDYIVVNGSLDNIAECPDWLLRMYVKVAKKGSVPTEPTTVGKFLLNLVEVTTEGGRNERLTSVCGSLFRTGIPFDKVLFFTKLSNQIAFRPPLPDDEVMTIYNSIKRSELRKRKELKKRNGE